MAKLTDAVKTFIVQQLACFDTPSQVAEAVKKEFNLTVTRQQVEVYNHYRKIGNAGEKWRALFDETRKAFLEDTSDIGISHRAVRLRALDRMAKKAEEVGNRAQAAALIEQAAKECGDMFVNLRGDPPKPSDPEDEKISIIRPDEPVPAKPIT